MARLDEFVSRARAGNGGREAGGAAGGAGLSDEGDSEMVDVGSGWDDVSLCCSGWNKS